MANKRNINILNKIKHKPILLESIFSFIEKRVFILIDFISKDKSLKSDLKQFFNKTKLKNNLSKELNINIKKYIIYRKDLEEKNKIKDIINFKYTSHEFNHYFTQDIINNKGEDDKIYFSLDDHNPKYEIYNYIAKYKIISDYKNNLFMTFFKIFINKDKIATSKNKYNNNDEYNNKYNIDYYYSDMNNILDYAFRKYYSELFFMPFDLINFMERNNNFIFFFEFFIFIFGINEIPKNLLKVYSFLLIAQYFKQNNIDINNIKDIDEIKITPKFIEDYYFNVKKYSIIERIIVKFYFYYECEINFNFNFLFYLLSLQSSLSLYNFQNKNKNPDNYIFLDKQYLDYIEELNIKQKIKLICIIDSHKYSYNNPSITYQYINELHFIIDKYNLNEMKNVPIDEIYSIFKHYLMALKYPENLETISFDDEFYIKRKIYNNDFLLNYFFNQYLLDNNNEYNILNKINLDNIIINADQFDNLYYFYKAIFVFNKMFPNLKNKYCIELDYTKINKMLSKEINSEKKFKMLIIDFNFKNTDDINIVFKNINNICDKNKDLNPVEILIMKNIQIGKNFILNNINFDDLENLPNLYELIISNKNNVSIGNYNLEKYMICKSKFNYLYLGYDSCKNLILYKLMKNKIGKENLYDIIHYYNQEIILLIEINEELKINLNKERTIIEIKDNSITNKNKKIIPYLKNYLLFKKNNLE